MKLPSTAPREQDGELDELDGPPPGGTLAEYLAEHPEMRPLTPAEHEAEFGNLAPDED